MVLFTIASKQRLEFPNMLISLIWTGREWCSGFKLSWNKGEKGVKPDCTSYQVLDSMKMKLVWEGDGKRSLAWEKRKHRFWRFSKTYGLKDTTCHLTHGFAGW